MNCIIDVYASMWMLILVYALTKSRSNKSLPTLLLCNIYTTGVFLVPDSAVTVVFVAFVNHVITIILHQ